MPSLSTAATPVNLRLVSGVVLLAPVTAKQWPAWSLDRVKLVLMVSAAMVYTVAVDGFSQRTYIVVASGL